MNNDMSVYRVYHEKQRVLLVPKIKFLIVFVAAGITQSIGVQKMTFTDGFLLWALQMPKIFDILF